MQPKADRVTIDSNESQIVSFLNELIVEPRLKLIDWSRTTKQPPNIRVGYPGQHLASLITGVEGDRSGARGHDLADGSEVKSCSRIDQLDKCKDCGAAVARSESECPACSSENIDRKDDSKWLFGIRTEAELATLLDGVVDRVLLLIGDHPNFEARNYSDLRFQAFEIWPKSSRAAHFRGLMSGYYHQIYLAHRANNPEKTPAPKNFWPYSFQFYMCNPIKTFQATIHDSLTEPRVTIDHYVDPKADREPLPSELMPSAALGKTEIEVLRSLADTNLQLLLNPEATTIQFRRERNLSKARSLVAPLSEQTRSLFSLRATDIPVSHSRGYARRVITTA